MGLRDIFRKLKNKHNTAPHSNYTDITKVQKPSQEKQQQQQHQKQDKSGLTHVDKDATM